MKKTIIALLVLSGIACADGEIKTWDLKVFTDSSGSTADLLTGGNGDFWFDSTSPLTTYSLDFTATTISAYEYDNFTLFSTSRGTGNQTDRQGLGIFSSTKNEAGSLTVTISKNVAAIDSSASLTIKTGDSLTFAYDSKSATALLYNATTQKLIQVNVGDDSDAYYLEAGSTTKTQGASAAFSQGGKHQITYGNVTNLSSMAGDMKAIKNYIGVVPEPTTATLSLLALAGLASRRRRR